MGEGLLVGYGSCISGKFATAEALEALFSGSAFRITGALFGGAALPCGAVDSVVSAALAVFVIITDGFAHGGRLTDPQVALWWRQVGGGIWRYAGFAIVVILAAIGAGLWFRGWLLLISVGEGRVVLGVEWHIDGEARHT